MARFFGKVMGREHAGTPRFAADWLIVGLGNPGEGHARDRHNVGFWTVNELAKRAGTQPKAQGGTMLIGLGTLQGQRVALVKPKTFMNASGKAVVQALHWTGCDLAHTVVIYDELDLAAGALRVRAGGGAGGHNGMRSIMGMVGGDFVRVRIGIGRPMAGGEPTWDPEAIAGYVLSSPQGEERQAVEQAAKLAADAVEAVIAEGPDAAGNRFNRK
jgi:PTH1 family peptidyl-tRNA hydrolase